MQPTETGIAICCLLEIDLRNSFAWMCPSVAATVLAMQRFKSIWHSGTVSE